MSILEMDGWFSSHFPMLSNYTQSTAFKEPAFWGNFAFLRTYDRRLKTHGQAD